MTTLHVILGAILALALLIIGIYNRLVGLRQNRVHVCQNGLRSAYTLANDWRENIWGHWGYWGHMKNLILAIFSGALLSACGGSSPEPTPAPPPPSNSAPSISGIPASATEKSAYSFTPTASDPDGDNLTFSITAQPSWLSFSTSTGTLSGTPGVANIGQYKDITISVSDGSLSNSLTFSINVNPDILEKALRTGDATDIANADVILTDLGSVFELTRTKFNSARAKLFGLSSTGQLTANSLTNLSWDPTHDAALLKASFGFNEAVLISNDVTHPGFNVEAASLGIVGQTENARYLVLGSNPMRNKYRGGVVSADMDAFLKNALAWLTDRDDLETVSFNVVIAQSAQSFYFPDQVANREWLTNAYPTSIVYNDAALCNGAALAGCIKPDTDVLIISQFLGAGEDTRQITDTVKAAMTQGTPVLYMHLDGNYGELAQALLPALNVRYVHDNYWRRQQLTSIDPKAGFATLPAGINAVKDLLVRLPADNFTFDLSACGNTSCPATSSYIAQFKQAALSLRSLFSRLDVRYERIFDTQEYRYAKLLILLADIYRRDVVYPMDKTSTPRRQFLRSYLSDHIVYTARDLAPAQAHMGNFSRSDFSHITPVAKTVSLTAKPDFRSTGAYALPGQTFTVTRTDNSAVNTHIFINTLRPSATHEFNPNAYNRPKYLKSSPIPIRPGESLSLTSSYGGPIQIGFDAKDLAVNLSFENIGEHPYWKSAADDMAFTAAMAAKEYDWAELATPAFEVHSKIEKMQQTIDNAKWGSAAAVAAGASRYMSNLPHVLAGFKGVGIDVVPEIHNFATSNNIEMASLDKIKHMNADQATCGAGCSGNPYDAYWAYDPIAHGDIHELGHGLARSQFMFSNWVRHAITNPYSYYAKSIYSVDTGANLNALGCQKLPFRTVFNRLQQSRKQVDPLAYMQAQNTYGWSESVVMTIQMMMAAQAEGVLSNGWHLLARLHIIERAYNKANNNDTDWLAARTGLGFGGYTRSEARALANDDWMLIALSHAAERDMRQFLTTWGIDFSNRARDQVAGFGYTSMPVQFFMANENDYCLGLNKPALPIDGNQVWP